MKFSYVLGAFGIFAAQSALADQVHFTGNTTADVTLIKDALQNILVYSKVAENCPTLDGVEAQILSPAYKPVDAATRPEAGNGTYESWTATLCGKSVKFLITFWPASEGGTMLAVTYPYPIDAP